MELLRGAEEGSVVRVGSQVRKMRTVIVRLRMDETESMSVRRGSSNQVIWAVEASRQFWRREESKRRRKRTLIPDCPDDLNLGSLTVLLSPSDNLIQHA